MSKQSVAVKALLGLCNNCQKIIHANPKVSINEHYITFSDPKPDIEGNPEIGNNPKFNDLDYHKGISINPILHYVYGEKIKYVIEERTNLTQRFIYLSKKKIITIKKDRNLYFSINDDSNTFKLIVKYLVKANKISDLSHTTYFQDTGKEHFDTLFKLVPEGLLDIDFKDDKQVKLYNGYVYSRFIRSPTFMNMLTSDKFAEKVSVIQKTLPESYLRQQATKGNFPFFQLLGTYCFLIDYLNDKIEADQKEIVECLNDTERMVYLVFLKNARETDNKITLLTTNWKKEKPKKSRSKKTKNKPKQSSKPTGVKRTGKKGSKP